VTRSIEGSRKKRMNNPGSMINAAKNMVASNEKFRPKASLVTESR